MKIQQLFQELSHFSPIWLQKNNPEADIFFIADDKEQDVFYTNTLYILKNLSNVALKSGNYLYLCEKESDVASFSHPAHDSEESNLICIFCKNIPSSERFSLFQFITDILLRYNQLFASLNRLLEIQYKNLGLQALVDTAYSFLQNPLLIVDSDYKILAASAVPIKKRPDLEEQIHRGYVLEENIQAIKSRKLYEKARKNHYPTYDKRPDNPEEGWITCMVYIHEIEVAHIAVSDLNRPFLSSDFTYVDSLSRIISVELQKNNFYKIGESMRHSFFLSDLIENNTADIHTITQRAKSLNWNFEKHMRIMTIFIDHQEHFDKKATLITSQLKHMLPGSRWTIYKESIVFLLNLNGTGIEKFRSNSALYEFLRVNSICAALSRTFRSLTEVRRKYEECQNAYRIGHRMDSQNVLYLYTDYICQYIGKVLEKTQSLDHFMHPTIADIMDYDRKHNSALLPTLKEFLLQPDDPKTASEKLFIHKNTYFYRLARIKELFSLNLSSGEERLLLHLSLKFLDLETR